MSATPPFDQRRVRSLARCNRQRRDLVQRDVVQIHRESLSVGGIHKRDVVRLAGVESALIEQYRVPDEPVRASVEVAFNAV